MKKSLFNHLYSFLFLFALVTVMPAFSGGSDAMAECKGGTTITCAAITNPTKATDCTNVGGCTFAAAGTACTGSETDTACSDINDETTCKNLYTYFRCAWTLPADTDNNAFVNTLCNALKIVTGNGGKAFAAFAIISLGIGFFTGKVSWGLMLGVSAGIAAMFGAPTIVAAISGENSFDCGS